MHLSFHNIYLVSPSGFPAFDSKSRIVTDIDLIRKQLELVGLKKFVNVVDGSVDFIDRDNKEVKTSFGTSIK